MLNKGLESGHLGATFRGLIYGTERPGFWDAGGRRLGQPWSSSGSSRPGSWASKFRPRAANSRICLETGPKTGENFPGKGLRGLNPPPVVKAKIFSRGPLLLPRSAFRFPRSPFLAPDYWLLVPGCSLPFFQTCWGRGRVWGRVRGSGFWRGWRGFREWARRRGTARRDRAQDVEVHRHPAKVKLMTRKTRPKGRARVLPFVLCMRLSSSPQTKTGHRAATILKPCRWVIGGFYSGPCSGADQVLDRHDFFLLGGPVGGFDGGVGDQRVGKSRGGGPSRPD